MTAVVSLGQWAVSAVNSSMACLGEGGSWGQAHTKGRSALWHEAMALAICWALFERGDDLKPCR